jgi:hypothetical protein
MPCASKTSGASLQASNAVDIGVGKARSTNSGCKKPGVGATDFGLLFAFIDLKMGKNTSPCLKQDPVSKVFGGYLTSARRLTNHIRQIRLA